MGPDGMMNLQHVQVHGRHLWDKHSIHFAMILYQFL